MSPELFDPEIQIHRRTKYSDRYALGMVIYEVLSGHEPFDQYTDYVVFGKVLKGERPERPRGQDRVAQFMDDVWDMLELCWATLPQNRPRIEDVLKCLEKGACSWTPPSPLPMAVPLAVNSLTWNTSDITSEQSVGVDEREVSPLSQPSDNSPPMDGAGSDNIHSPARGFLALLRETPDHQDLGADAMVPGEFTSSTPPPFHPDDRLQLRSPQLFDPSLGTCSRDEWRDEYSFEILELEFYLGIRREDGWRASKSHLERGQCVSYLERLRVKSFIKRTMEAEERYVSRQRSPNVSETDSAFSWRPRNPSTFASYIIWGLAPFSDSACSPYLFCPSKKVAPEGFCKYFVVA